MSLQQPCRPFKMSWHGSDSVGRQDSPKNTCNYWNKPKPYQRAFAGRLGIPGSQAPSLLRQTETKCNKPLVLFCIEAYSIGNTPTPRTDNPWSDY